MRSRDRRGRRNARVGRGYGDGELYRRENGKAEGNLNEETRDNAWAKRPEQNRTPFGVEEEEVLRGSGLEKEVWWSRREGEMGENNRGIKLEAATE